MAHDKVAAAGQVEALKWACVAGFLGFDACLQLRSEDLGMATGGPEVSLSLGVPNWCPKFERMRCTGSSSCEAPRSPAVPELLAGKPPEQLPRDRRFQGPWVPRRVHTRQGGAKASFAIGA